MFAKYPTVFCKSICASESRIALMWIICTRGFQSCTRLQISVSTSNNYYLTNMDCLRKTKRFKNKHPVWSDTPLQDKKEEEVLVAEAHDALDKDQDEEQHHDTSASENENRSDSESSDDDDYEMYAGDVRSDKITLETKDLHFKHLTNINNERSFSGGVQHVQFHPKSKVALVALRGGQIDLFEVDGERNRYLQNIKLPKSRGLFCSFDPVGDKIVIASENYKQTFYTYDMISTKTQQYKLRDGRDLKDMTDFVIHKDFMACRKESSNDVYVLSSKTFEVSYTVRLNEPVRTVQFTNDNELFIAGEDSRVYIWDLRKTSICTHRFQDEGTVHTTSMSISLASNLISLGSDTGVVNSYELDTCRTARFPTPVKSFFNINKPINITRYNHSGELLLFGSKDDYNAFRMVHAHSGIVYKNFPSQAKKYGHLQSVDFSPLSGYLMLGCSNGRAYLCRLPYFRNY